MKKFKILSVMLFVFAAFILIGCSKKDYTVTFETNGGSPVEAQTVSEGSKLTEVTSSKEGYTFEGWGKDAQYSSMWNFASDTVTGNITLYAKWKENETPAPTEYTITFNSNGGSSVAALKVVEGAKASKPADPTKAEHTFGGWFTDEALQNAYSWDAAVNSSFTLFAKWDVVVVTPTSFTATLVYNNGSENGSLTSSDVDGSQYFTAPSNPVKDYNEFSHWSLEENGAAFDFSQAVTSDIILYAVYTPKYDTVVSNLDILKFAAIINPEVPAEVTITENTQFGKFLIEGGKTRFETTSGKEALNTQGKSIWFTLSGEGTNNSITIKGKGASSSGDWVRITNLDTNEVVKEWTGIGSNVEFEETIENLPAGNYEYSNYKSVRISVFSLTEKLPQAPVQGIELDTSATQTNFLLGSEFNYDGLNAKLVYTNGRIDNIDINDLICMVKGFDAAGKKTVEVYYEDYVATYEVNVCEIESLVLYDYVLDSSRVSHHRQEVFAVGGTFEPTNLVVKAKCLVPETDKYIEFLLSSEDYTLSNVDLSTAGKKTVTVTYGEKTASYDVHAVAVPDMEIPAYGVVIDNTKTEVVTENNLLVFPTINQGLQYLELLNLDDSAIKMIVLTAGQTYFEKVEINMPNFFLYTGEYNADAQTYVQVQESNKFATIEYDALAGELDASETVAHSTDGSATVSIRKNATDVVVMGVRFKNYYNTHELYLETKTRMNDTQAVACLVQADRVIFLYCEFTSYHDTLYVQSGRHYFNQCYIEGRTDYIFGYDSTSVFQGCTIKSLGAGLTEKNGGYIVATKGNLIGSQNINYGIVFDQCTLTGDENVQLGTVSIARGWDKGMTVMVMNSEISGHFSKEAYGYTESELNDRYTKMNADPVASQLFEYNNTGDGAITESIENTCTYATAEVAARYASLLDMFTPNNGTTLYDLPWSPANEKDAVVEVVDGKGKVLYTSDCETYYGSVFTPTLIDAMKEAIVLPEGASLEGLYLDATYETKLDRYAIINEGTKIYANIEGGKSSITLTYDERTEAVEGWTVYMASAGSSKLGNDEGVSHSSDASLLVQCDKLVAGTDYLLSPKFTAGNSVVAKILCGTTSTSNAVNVLVEALDAEGNVVASITATGPANKVTGYAENAGEKFVELTSESANIVQIRISCTTSGKNICVVSCELEVALPVIEPVKQTLTYDERTEAVEGWTVYMASAGSSKLGNDEGVSHSSDASLLVQCDKLVAGTDYLLSPKFTAGNSVVAKILCGTTSTSNAVNVLVEALDAEGNVVASITATGPANKVTGYAENAGEKFVELTSESANIVQIRISCTTSGKNICVVSCELEVSTLTTEAPSKPEDDGTIKTNTSWIGGSSLTGNGGEGLTLTGTALRDNGDGSYQFSADSALSLKVAANAMITLTGHSQDYGVFDIYVNGTKLELTATSGVYTFEVTAGSKVEIKTSDASHSYIKGLDIAF